jgi:hypothetical protein
MLNDLLDALLFLRTNDRPTETATFSDQIIGKFAMSLASFNCWSLALSPLDSSPRKQTSSGV